jgi:hypothetical protein
MRAISVSSFTFELINHAFSAFHGMKYIDRPAINDIIHDFQQISSRIEADHRILVYKAFHLAFIYFGFNNFANIGFGNIVLEG